jgi:hypothetical protein
MITIADLLDALKDIECTATHFALAVATQGSRPANAGTSQPVIDEQRKRLDDLLVSLNTKVRPCLDEAQQQPPFDVIAALEWATNRLAAVITTMPDATEYYDRTCLAKALEVLTHAKHTRDTNLLAAARAALALWDKYGLGDEDSESEPVYHILKDAVEGYDYSRSKHDRPCPF